MQLSKWSHEIASLALVAAVLVIALSNSGRFTGMIVSEQNGSVQVEEPPLGGGCEYVDVPYTENVCTDEKYNYTISRDQFLNSRYGVEHVCTGVVFIENHDGPGWWKLGYVFEINNETFVAEPERNYVSSGTTGRFIFERLCEENTTFGGTYFIEEEPVKTLCGPATLYRKEAMCGVDQTQSVDGSV